jgi:hypothetical protein
MIQMLLRFVLALATIAEQPQNPGSTPNGVSPHSEDDAQQLRSVKPEDPVITVSGICRDTQVDARNSATCKTIVTREQFDRLIAALAVAGQPVPSNERRQLAQAYVDLLAYREAASGTENSPEFRDLMDLVRLRTLSEIHRRNLQARYRTPSPQDIDAYYHQHISNFTEIKLHRILIPKRNPSVEDQEKYRREALHVANDLRERAARGGDFDQLQKQGYASLSLPSPPATDMGNRRTTNLLPEERDEILALSAGGVSKVEEEAFSFVIYRVDEKSVLPEEAVKEEIAHEISRQRLENALKEISSGVHPEFNEQYFPSAPSPSANPSASAPPGPQQSPTRMPK